ncbi:Sugar phosphate permease [Pseudonocardia thermophila]|jgi:Sugar phosphate permease|uniref:Sugar phosphate permease n=1 Tax=Pseudonocardia thermophila TaxID=1848 RepID=A0A1M6SC17_PSETH|nr:MFS transporter [Pseudonocardia thermophila]SHK42179.1 Sugar phosphate permease [Pseudonocardia thermophila]
MPRPDRYRWVVLAVGAAAQAATSAYFLGLASITPALRVHFGLDLPGVGTLLGTIALGLVLTLIAWGSAADRFGERGVMTVGLLGAAIALGAAAVVPNPAAVGLLLALAGASGASVNSASGRAVLTWFPAERRGFAMSIRQTAVPVGGGLAALVLPGLADTAGVPAAFAALGGFCAVAAVAVAIWVTEPPGSPARGTAERAGFSVVLRNRRLLLLSVAAFSLVIPQSMGLTFLVELLHDSAGFSPAVAAAVLAGVQALSVVGRLSSGLWSDQVGSRLGPLRITAVVVAAAFALAAALEPGPAALFVIVLVPAVAISASWNGLVYAAAGELAPPGRAATAMAVSNTAAFVSAAVGPMVGGVIAHAAGWPAMLACGAVVALLARLALAGGRQDARSRAATSVQKS